MSIWVQRALSMSLGVQDVNDLYRLVVQRLNDEGLLQRYSKGTSNAYGLNPAVILITHQTAGVRCPTCGQAQTVNAARSLSGSIGPASASYQCVGHYALDTRTAQHYYRAVYERGEVQRIFSHEHTSLLNTRVRQNVEVTVQRSQRRCHQSAGGHVHAGNGYRHWRSVRDDGVFRAAGNHQLFAAHWPGRP